MGVQEMRLILRKYAPSATTHHRDILDFRRKTLAIDGGLQTVKFHHRRPQPTWSQSLVPPSLSAADSAKHLHIPFSSEHDPNRHVKSWYKLIIELQTIGIKPIVVFDGSTRVPEKARELEWRMIQRDLARRRGRAEEVRTARMQNVREALGGAKATGRKATSQMVETSHGADVGSGQAHATEPSAEPATPASARPTPVAAACAGVADPLPRSEELARLSLAAAEDRINPIQSKNQRALSDAEAQFFADLAHSGFVERSHDNGTRTATAASFTDLFPGASTKPPPVPPTAPPEPPTVPVAEELEAPAAAKAVAEGAVECEVEGQPVPSYVPHQDVREAVFGLSRLLEKNEGLGASYTRRGEGVPQRAFTDSLELLLAMGIPCLVPSPSAPAEAEALCATLVHLGLADFVLSEDRDVLLLDAPLLSKLGFEVTERVTESGEVRREGMCVIDPVKARAELGLTREEFVELCLLCGTDFTERIKGVGPVTALKLMKRHRSIEAILANHPPAVTALAKTGTTPAAYLATVRAARALFLTPAPLPAGLPDGWNEARPPSDELPALLAKWGIAQGDETAEGEHGADLRGDKHGAGGRDAGARPAGGAADGGSGATLGWWKRVAMWWRGG